RARRLRRPRRRRDGPRRRDGGRHARAAAALRRGQGVRRRGRRRCSARGRDPARRRPRVRLVPLEDAPGPRPAGARATGGGLVNLNVNGIQREVESGPLTTLLDVLREELGVTSPKAGCEQGGCGACTVLVDGEPRRACLLPVGAVNGAEITTVEGL